MMLRDERNEDKPPYSRVFVVCDKQFEKDDLRPLFEKYGEIEYLTMPKDRVTGESKGIAYIKYTKTSSAAAAIDGLHMKNTVKGRKALKVMVATTKNEENNDNEDKYKRLFIKVPKSIVESDIKDHFSEFGYVSHVHLQKDRESNECRGFAYVHYNTFFEAAKAFEGCDKKYMPVFAIPKDELKRTRNFEPPRSFDQPMRFNPSRNFELFDPVPYSSNDSLYMREHKNDFNGHHREHDLRDSVTKSDNILPLIKTIPGDFDTVNVICSAPIPLNPIERLFNIIPGMVKFKVTSDLYKNVCAATVKYDSKVAAAHAIASINNYEFPSGQVITIKPENPIANVAKNLSQIVNNLTSGDTPSDLMQLAEAIAQASTLLKVASVGSDLRTDSSIDKQCSVPLPPVKPRGNPDSTEIQSCFLVFKPRPPPLYVLQDVFSRFGDLIDVHVIPNKTFGFAKYASARSAADAINTLNNATVCGITMKVLESDESKKGNKGKIIVDDDEEQDRKRARLDEIWE